MFAQKLYSEIFKDIELAVNKEQRIDILRRYDHPALRLFFEYLYNDKIIFDVEIPKYRPAPEPVGLNFTYLDFEIKKLYRYVKNEPRADVLSAKKKTELLTVTLESLHKDEAELLVGLIKKDIGVPHLTEDLIKEAYGL